MATVKIAVSIDESLFQEAESLASEMGTSRSRLIALALAEYLSRHRMRKLRARIDAAYGDSPTPAEAETFRRRRRQHRLVVEGEW